MLACLLRVSSHVCWMVGACILDGCVTKIRCAGAHGFWKPRRGQSLLCGASESGSDVKKMPLVDRSNRSSTRLYHAKLLGSLVESGPLYFSFEQLSACPPERKIAGRGCVAPFVVVTDYVVVVGDPFYFEFCDRSRICENFLNTERQDRIRGCLVCERLRSASRIPTGTERKREEHGDCSNTCADSAMCPFLLHDTLPSSLTEKPPGMRTGHRCLAKTRKVPM